MSTLDLTDVDSLNEIGALKQAIDSNDVERIKALMTRNPALHRAPLGYGKAGPLTWVAECRVPWERPGPQRLAIAKWMIENGSDIHQGGDAPLMRAALGDCYGDHGKEGDRIPMMELLVAHGADVHAEWNGEYPIIFAPCETVDPVALKWLLDHGANPNCSKSGRSNSALNYVIETYMRSSGASLSQCIEHLFAAKAVTRHQTPVVIDLLRGRLDRFEEQLALDPTLVHRRYLQLDFGETAGRGMSLSGATLLHVAAEFAFMDAAKLLIDHAADVNARGLVDASGVGGQTPIFHAASQYLDKGLPMTQFLVERGADLSIRAKIRGDCGVPTDFVEYTPLGYALRFPGGEHTSKTVTYLREQGAPE
jgi:ankyrin repeat protein